MLFMGIDIEDELAKIFSPNPVLSQTECPVKEPVTEGEQVVTSLIKHPVLVRMFLLRCRLVDACKQSVADHQAQHKSGGAHDCQAWAAEMESVEGYMQALNKMFWAYLQRVCGLMGQSVGLRADWQVVKMPNKEIDLADVLGELLGRRR